jgi:hypothetical protein
VPRRRIAAGAANGVRPTVVNPGVGNPYLPLQSKPAPPGLPGGPGGPPLPGQPPIYMPLGRPITPQARTANSIFFAGSIGWICLNEYWGSPIALVGCTSMVMA